MHFRTSHSLSPSIAGGDLSKVLQNEIRWGFFYTVISILKKNNNNRFQTIVPFCQFCSSVAPGLKKIVHPNFFLDRGLQTCSLVEVGSFKY